MLQDTFQVLPLLVVVRWLLQIVLNAAMKLNMKSINIPSQTTQKALVKFLDVDNKNKEVAASG